MHPLKFPKFKKKKVEQPGSWCKWLVLHPRLSPLSPLPPPMPDSVPGTRRSNKWHRGWLWHHPASVSIWRGKGVGPRGSPGRGGGGESAKHSLAPGTLEAATPLAINLELPQRGRFQRQSAKGLRRLSARADARLAALPTRDSDPRGGTQADPRSEGAPWAGAASSARRRSSVPKWERVSGADCPASLGAGAGCQFRAKVSAAGAVPGGSRGRWREKAKVPPAPTGRWRTFPKSDVGRSNLILFAACPRRFILIWPNSVEHKWGICRDGMQPRKLSSRGF